MDNKLITVDDLIGAAKEYTELAISSNRQEDRAKFAAIASAAAQTAQAMIMHAQAQEIAASNERAELCELWRQ